MRENPVGRAHGKDHPPTIVRYRGISSSFRMPSHARPATRQLPLPGPIGRTAELAKLRVFLSQTSGVLLISGEAGIGKSRLVQEARSLPEAAGISSLVGRSFEADRALPYAPALDLLQNLRDLLGPTEIARLAGPASVDLAHLLPELAPQTHPPATFPDDESAKRRLRQRVLHLWKPLLRLRRMCLLPSRRNGPAWKLYL